MANPGAATKTNSSKNSSLSAAKLAKEDEFYTQLADIERELKHYKSHFKDKVVYCNCDDPRVSNFFHYFAYNFEKLGLKELITTCYKSTDSSAFTKNDSERACYLSYKGDLNKNNLPDFDEIGIEAMAGDGDFRSDESVALLKRADIVVTNPPFSLFREYVAQLIEHDKKFVIIGPKNAVTYKGIFELFQENKVWLGYGFMGGNAFFKIPDAREFAKGVYDQQSGLVKFRNVTWFTNLDIAKRHEELVLVKSYRDDEYPTYDNFDAIEVAKVAEIPRDYDGAMGVPKTFLDRYNPDQFEILGVAESWFGAASKTYPRQTQVSASGAKSSVTKLNDGAAIKVAKAPTGKTYYEVDGELFTKVYARLLIKRRTA